MAGKTFTPLRIPPPPPYHGPRCSCGGRLVKAESVAPRPAPEIAFVCPRIACRREYQSPPPTPEIAP